MAYRIACTCGKGVFAELADAGGRLTCGCGRAVEVPLRSRLLRLPPVYRRDQPPPPPTLEGEEQRSFSSAKWWFLTGVGVLLAGMLSMPSQKSPGLCLDVVGVGLMVVGGLRFVRGLVQKRGDRT